MYSKMHICLIVNARRFVICNCILRIKLLPNYFNIFKHVTFFKKPAVNMSNGGSKLHDLLRALYE